MYEIFDSHAHIYPDKIADKAAVAIGNFYDIPMDGNGSVNGLLKEGNMIGVSKYLVHSVATSKHQVHSINTFLLSQVKAHSEFIGFMTLHPDMTEEELGEEIEFGISNGFYGIKLHPDFQKFAIDSEENRRILNVLDNRLPLLYHTGDHRYNYSTPDQMAKVAKEYPKTRFIAAHFGGWSQWDLVEEAYKGTENVSYDTSSSLSFISPEKATELIHAMGAEKFFFGSDFPMWRAVDEFERFMKLGLSEAEREGILAQNLKAFLGIV